MVKILLGFYTPEEDQNDLSLENSQWIPYLINPDGSVTRTSCIDVDEENGRIYMKFLKWDLSWSKLYLLCFPYSPELHEPPDGLFRLVISGSQGQGEIRLQAAPPEDKQ